MSFYGGKIESPQCYTNLENIIKEKGYLSDFDQFLYQFGKYKQVSFLGSGAFSRVYLVVDRLLKLDEEVS